MEMKDTETSAHIIEHSWNGLNPILIFIGMNNNITGLEKTAEWIDKHAVSFGNKLAEIIRTAKR